MPPNDFAVTKMISDQYVPICYTVSAVAAAADCFYVVEIDSYTVSLKAFSAAGADSTVVFAKYWCAADSVASVYL